MTKPRNYTKKFMIQKGIGKTQIIPNKKKNCEKHSTREYLEECEEDLDDEEDLEY